MSSKIRIKILLAGMYASLSGVIIDQIKITMDGVGASSSSDPCPSAERHHSEKESCLGQREFRTKYDLEREERLRQKESQHKEILSLISKEKCPTYEFTGEEYELRFVLEDIMAKQPNPKAELVSPDSFNPSRKEDRIIFILHLNPDTQSFALAELRFGKFYWMMKLNNSMLCSKDDSCANIKEFMDLDQFKYKISPEVKQALSQPGMPYIFRIAGSAKVEEFNTWYTKLSLGGFVGFDFSNLGCKFDGEAIWSTLELKDQHQYMLILEDDQKTLHNMILKLVNGELVLNGTAEDLSGKWKCEITGLNELEKELNLRGKPTWIEYFKHSDYGDLFFISCHPSGYHSDVDETKVVRTLSSQINKRFTLEVTTEGGIKNIKVTYNAPGINLSALA